MGHRRSQQAGRAPVTVGTAGRRPIVELEFLYSARSLADRLEKRRLLREVFGRVAMSERAYQRAGEVQQLRLCGSGSMRHSMLTVSRSRCGYAPRSRGAIEEIARLVAAGQLRVPIAATFPVGQIRAAVELQAGRHVHGKVVIVL